MGFRPAVHEIQRDQYGDHAVLVVGDDSPLQGKVPPGWMMTQLPVDPYAPVGGTPALAGLTPATLASGGGYPGGIPPFWGGGSGGSGNPGVPGGTSPGTPQTPIPPIRGDSSEPPTRGDTSTQPPLTPELPDVHPVPGPEAGILLLSALVVLTVMRSAKRALRA